MRIGLVNDERQVMGFKSNTAVGPYVNSNSTASNLRFRNIPTTYRILI